MKPLPITENLIHPLTYQTKENPLSVKTSAPHIDESCKGETLFADSAYAGEGFAEKLEGLEVENFIHQKGYKNRPLSDIQKQMNKVKSSIRCRVEHIFG
jgi:IS5 family transposase